VSMLGTEGAVVLRRREQARSQSGRCWVNVHGDKLSPGSESSWYC